KSTNEQDATLRGSIMFVSFRLFFRTMTTNPRQQRLLEEVKRRGSMSVEGLSQLLEVTAQTIRRDVTALSQAGLLARFHGGVGLPSSTVENIAYSQRQSLNNEGKRRIAQAVAAR